MILAMAWRNLVRNARRSFITIAAIAIGMAALLFLWGFNDGMHNRMMRNVQESLVGSLQVHRAGYFQRPRLSDHINDPAGITAAMQEAGIRHYTLRLQAFALAAGKDSSEGTMLLGVQPGRETKVSNLWRKVEKGRFLKPGDDDTCVIGQTTARNLKVKVGDSLVMLSQDRFDALAAERFRVVGIIASGEMGVDRGLVMAPLASVQRMLGMQGRVTGVVALTDDSQLEASTAFLKQHLASKGYEVLRWFDMVPVMKEWVSLDNGFYYIFLGIVLMIVVVGVLNTVLVSMLERIHELGVCMALGASGRQIALMVISESLLLAGAGVGLGTSAGLALVWFYGRVGIDFSAQLSSLTRYYIDPVVYTEIDTDHLLATVILVSLGIVIASLYPAIKAMRLQPVEAIRHV